MRLSSPLVFAFASVSLLLPGPLAQADPMRERIENYQADAELLARHGAIAGDSKAVLAREKKLLRDWQKRLEKVEFLSLSPDQRIDFILFGNELASSLEGLARQEESGRELSDWLPMRQAIEMLADGRMRGAPLEPERAAGMLATLPKDISDLQEKLKAAHKARTQPPKTEKTEKTEKRAAADPASSEAELVRLPTPYEALRCAEAVEELSASLKRWFENDKGFNPEFGWWVKQPYEEVAQTLAAYTRFLREDLAGIKGGEGDPLLGRAIGAEALQKQLRREYIPYTPQELIETAERELAWCEEQMRSAAREMGLGDDWKTALGRTKLLYVKPGEQEKVAREEAREAIDFVKSHQLVTVPPECEEWWGTRMLSSEEQKQIPYAAYGGHDMLIAYASENMKHADKLMTMRGNSRPFMHNVVPHELIPGHHLQSFMAARNRPYRRIFSTPFFVEGWALYWEMRLWDLGYHDTPEEKVGALFWRMHRCARIIVTLKFHLGEMQPAEMVKFLTNRVGHETFGATSEVRRYLKGDFSPLYQCAYLLGGLQLRALHEEVVGAGKMTEQQFHDQILTLGPIPVELLRASVTGLPLTPDYPTRWKFDSPSKQAESDTAPDQVEKAKP